MIPFQKPMTSSKEMIETFNIPHVSNLLIQIWLIPIQYRYTSNHMIHQTISTEPTFQMEHLTMMNLSSLFQSLDTRLIYRFFIPSIQMFSQIPLAVLISYHKINTGDQDPVRTRPYPLSPAKRRTLNQQIDEMLTVSSENHTRHGVVHPFLYRSRVQVSFALPSIFANWIASLKPKHILYQR